MRLLSYILLIGLLSSASSCVTMFGRPYTHIKLSVPERSLVTYRNWQGQIDSVIAPVGGSLRITPSRSSKKLAITINNSSNADTTIFLKPIYSNLYGLNMLNLGLGILVDRSNPNRFGYQQYFKFGNSVRLRKPYVQPKTEILLRPFSEFGDVYFSGVTKRPICANAAIGVNYFVTPRRSLSTDIGYAAGPLQFGERIYRGIGLPPVQEIKRTWYATLQQHYVLRRLDLGYGFCVQKAKAMQYMRLRPFSTGDDIDSVVGRTTSTALGIALSVDYRLTRAFYAGVSYKQFLFALDNRSGLGDAHMIFFGFSWRIPVMYNKRGG